MLQKGYGSSISQIFFQMIKVADKKISYKSISMPNLGYIQYQYRHFVQIFKNTAHLKNRTLGIQCQYLIKSSIMFPQLFKFFQMKAYFLVFLFCTLAISLNVEPDVVIDKTIQEVAHKNVANSTEQNKNVVNATQTSKVSQNVSVKVQAPKAQEPKIQSITVQKVKIQTVKTSDPITIQVKKQIPLNTDGPVEQAKLQPIDIITEKQTKQRQSVNMIYDNHHGYPFAITPGMELSFYLEYPTDQIIKGEVYSFFIEKDNTIVSPTYELGEQLQSITLQIWQNQPANMRPKKVFQKSCLTQMGIQFQAKKNTKYTLMVINPSERKASKMVQLALSHKHLSHQILKSQSNQISKGFKQTEYGTFVLKNQLTSRLRHIQQVMVMQDTIRDKMLNTSSKYFGYAIWQILLFGILMAGQVAMVNRIMNKSFSSVV